MPPPYKLSHLIFKADCKKSKDLESASAVVPTTSILQAQNVKKSAILEPTNSKGLKSLAYGIRDILSIKKAVDFLFPKVSGLDSETIKYNMNLSIFAIVNIFIMICIFSPFAVYSSDVSQFNADRVLNILYGLCGICMFLSLFFIYIVILLRKSRALKFVSFSLSVLLCVGVMYTFVLVGDYGTMDNFVLKRQPGYFDFLLKLKVYGLFILTFLGSVLFVIFMWDKLKMLMQIFSIALVMSSAVFFYDIHTEILAKNTESSLEYEKEAFAYAKSEKNVVIFMLDAFGGSHMPYILEQFPNLKAKLDGFVLFDNALGSGNGTVWNVPAILGGIYYTHYNIYKRGDKHTQSIADAYSNVPMAFYNAGYEAYVYVQPSGLMPFKPMPFIMDNVGDKVTVSQSRGEFLPLFVDNAEEELKDKYLKMLSYKDDILQAFNVGLFRFAPELFFRPRIYNAGKWLFNINNKNIVLEYASSLYAFTHLASADSKKPTFKFLHSLMAHPPHALSYINGKCEFFADGSIWQDDNLMYHHKDMAVRDYFYQHYDSEVCSMIYLAHFIDWLKDNGIYDNTQIILVSDHGGADSISFPLDEYYYSGDILFMLKDFNARGGLRVDSRLMADFDVASIVCENLPNGCPNVPKNILKNYPSQRKLIHSELTDAHISTMKDSVTPREIYLVQDILSDVKNWQDISAEVLNGSFDLEQIR